MGWDPTMYPIENTSPRQYKIKLLRKTYTTLETIQDHGADRLLSRGARLFKVQDDETEEIGVLKDLWLDKTRQSEDEIYNQILKDIERVFSVADMEAARRYLMTPKVSCFVKIGPKPDVTKSHLLEKNSVNLSNRVKLVETNPLSIPLGTVHRFCPI